MQMPESHVVNPHIDRIPSLLPTPQQAAWQDLEYGMFVHLGLYAFTGVFTGILWASDNPLYSASLDPVDPSIFYPISYDAEQWVVTAKEAGMHYVMVTAKHHDGFCLWPTATSEHSVKNSTWRGGKGDVIRELSDACHAHGIGFGIYLSPWDAYAYGTLKLSDSDYDVFFKHQLTELLTQYGDVVEVWLDGAGARWHNHDMYGYYRLIKSIQPNAIVAISGPSDVRWHWEVPEEQGLAPDPNWNVVNVSENWQDRMTIFSFWPTELLGNDYWWPGEAYVPIDAFWSGQTGLPFGHDQDTTRSTDELIHLYHGSVGRGANLVVNFVPETTGLLAYRQVHTIREVGEQLAHIYARNLLCDGKTTASGVSDKSHVPAQAIDGKLDTWWQADSRVAWLEVETDHLITFDRVVMQEAIVCGQRVHAYLFWWWDGSDWQLASKGTTIGHKKIDIFAPVTTTRIRLEISESADPPTLREFGVYNGHS